MHERFHPPCANIKESVSRPPFANTTINRFVRRNRRGRGNGGGGGIVVGGEGWTIAIPMKVRTRGARGTDEYPVIGEGRSSDRDPAVASGMRPRRGKNENDMSWKIENPFVKIVVRITSTYLGSDTRDDDLRRVVLLQRSPARENLGRSKRTRGETGREREEDRFAPFSPRTCTTIHLEPRTHVV